MHVRPWHSPCRIGTAYLLLALTACHSIGPATVPRDRIDYLGSLGNSWKQQTLLNVVKLRYGDVPVFLEVSQVIAGYQVQTTVAGGVTAGNASAANIGPFVVSGTAAVGDTYTDRPTVIYAPLSGVDFLKQLMTPIPPSAVLFLLQSGYSARVSLSLVLDSINGVDNEVRRGNARPADPRFTRLATLLTELQQSGAVETRIERPKQGGETALMLFGPSPNPQTEPGGAAERPLVTILSGDSAPKEASVAVEYHGHWFWIPDTDIQSKYAFGFVMLLFSISGTGLKAGAPVVTVPAQ